MLFFFLIICKGTLPVSPYKSVKFVDFLTPKFYERTLYEHSRFLLQCVNPRFLMNSEAPARQADQTVCIFLLL